MRIIDRYIVGNILKIFFTTILVFCFLYLIIDITSQLDEFINRHVSLPILLRYYFWFFPTILAQTASIACLIATLFSFANLNNTNEITAMRSSGLGFWEITRTALIFSLLISSVIFLINERVIPHASSITERIRNEHMVLSADREKTKKETITNLTFYGLKNRLYFIDSFDAGNNELNGITIIEYDNNANVAQKIVALNGKWTGIAWKFYKCQIASYEEGTAGKPVKIKIYNEKLMDIKETPDDFLKQRLNVSVMNIQELNQYIKRFSNSGASKALNNLRVDLHEKIAYPFATFVIVLIGLPFSLMIKSRKGTTFAAMGVALIVAFLYYVANAVSLAFGKGGLFPPLLAAWLPPLIFIGAAITIIETDLS